MAHGALSGRCLCGAVRFAATPKTMEMGVCRCAMCRRWAGGAFMAVSCGVGVEVEDASRRVMSFSIRYSPFAIRDGSGAHG